MQMLVGIGIQLKMPINYELRESRAGGEMRLSRRNDATPLLSFPPFPV